MDPTAALVVIRELIEQVGELEIRQGNFILLADLAIDLAQHVKALDTWMACGGAVPKQWQAWTLNR
jgi:hypothetical protein